MLPAGTSGNKSRVMGVGGGLGTGEVGGPGGIKGWTKPIDMLLYEDVALHKLLIFCNTWSLGEPPKEVVMEHSILAVSSGHGERQGD